LRVGQCAVAKGIVERQGNRRCQQLQKRPCFDKIGATAHHDRQLANQPTVSR
jgi:hypothetical protein